MDEETNSQVISPPRENIHGCEILEKPKHLKAEKFIWILKRGVCTYGKKAKNAQFSGALAVIVVHDNPHAEIENLIPYADSHFHSLQTPILLIGKKDGEILLNALENFAQLIMALRIEVNGKKTEKADAEFWLDPVSIEAYDLLAKFGPLVSEFGNELDFAPKYKFQNLQGKNHSPSFIEKHCFANGKYCSLGTDNFDSHSVIIEGIRQICLWNNDPQKTKLSFWKYISHYRLCLRAFEFDHKGVLDCYQDSFKKANTSPQLISTVKNCIQSSFENPEHKNVTRNFILETQKNPYTYSDIYLVPACIINGELLKEELTDHSILRGFCDELVNPPGVCDQYFFGGRRIKSMYHIQESLFGLLLLCIAGSVLLILFILFLVRRSLNKRVDRELFVEINQHVTNYMKISQ